MALYALPSIAEQVFSDYLSANYLGNYGLVKSFSVEEYSLPLVLIKAYAFKVAEQDTNIFEGELEVAIFTQPNDVDVPITVHDNTVAQIYDLLANQEAVFTFCNTPGNRFHLFGFILEEYDQEANEGSISSVLKFKIVAQTLEIP